MEKRVIWKFLCIIFGLFVFPVVLSAQNKDVVLYVTKIRYGEKAGSNPAGWYLLHGINLTTGHETNVIINYCEGTNLNQDSASHNKTQIQLFDVIKLQAELSYSVPSKGGGALRMNRTSGIYYMDKSEEGGGFDIVSIDIKKPVDLFILEMQCPNMFVPKEWLVWRAMGQTSW